MADNLHLYPELRRECEVFCRYLTGREPTDYVIESYIRFHVKVGLSPNNENAIDQILLSLSRLSPFASRLVDSYSSLFCKTGKFRKKLLLVLAVVECAPPYFELLDTPDSSYILIVFVKLLLRVGVFTLSLGLASLLFAPLHAISAIPITQSFLRRRTWIR